MCAYQSIYQIIWSSNTLSGISEFGYGLNYAFVKNVFSPLSKMLKWTFIIVAKLYESALPSSHKGHRWNVAGLKWRVMEKIQYLCLLLKCQGWVNGFLYFLGLGSYYISLTAIREKRLLCKLAWRITQFIFLLCKPEKKWLLINPLGL